MINMSLQWAEEYQVIPQSMWRSLYLLCNGCY